MATSSRHPPLSPREGWISNGRQVLHFLPLRYDRWGQSLEVTYGELIPGQAIPLLKHRKQCNRAEALQLWTQKWQEGWRLCPPQWSPPPELKWRLWTPATSMGTAVVPPCF
ncbi:MAG: DUF1651 domain-containing protein [Synechococcus lacustris]